MAELSFAGDLEAQITCAICNEIFNEPKTLPCLHTFCFKCIKSWNDTCQKDSKTLRCPTCRDEVNIEGGDISKLPSSFTYNSLLQLFDSMKIKANEQDQQRLFECIGCSKRDVLVGYCPQCGGMICGECMTAHTTVNLLIKSHKATLLSEFNPDILNSYINNQAFCKEKFHDKIRLEYYCKTCRKCICQKCAATAHSSHDKVSIEQAAEDAKMLIREGKDRLNKLIVKYHKKLDLSNETMRRMQSDVDAVKTEVRKDVLAAIKILQKQEEALIATLDDILMQHKIANDERNSEITDDIEKFSKVKHKCETMENSNLEHFILEGYENLLDGCKATMENKSILSTKTVKSPWYIPNPEVIPVMQTLKLGDIRVSVDPSRCCMEPLGKVRCGLVNEFHIVTRDSAGSVCHIDKSSIDVKIQDVHGNYVKKELSESETGRFLVKFRAERSPLYRVAVSVEGSAIPKSPLTVKADLKTYRAAKIFGRKKGLVQPVSMALDTDQGLLVIVDAGCKENFVFNLDSGQHLREFGGKGSGGGRLKNPLGVISNGDGILVSDNVDGRSHIKEFAIDGTYDRIVYSFVDAILSRMCRANQKIGALSYQKSTTNVWISILEKNKDKTMHHSLVSLPVSRDDLGEPFSLTYDNNKYFVSFCGKNTVYVFDENGSLLYTIGEKGNKEGQFNGVRGLAAFKKEILFVCDERNNRVQVFSQDGYFISSFGSSGSALGEMNKPHDIAVTPDGRVFVLELGGKRVQEWRPV